MMFYNKLVIITIFLISLFFIQQSYAENGLTFIEAVNRLYGTNEKIEASSEDIRSRLMEKHSSFGLYFPKFSLNAIYTHLDKPIGISADLSHIQLPIPVQLPNINMVIQKEDMFSLSLNGIWPLFTGGKIYAANKATSLRVEVAKAKSEHIKSLLVNELASSYFGLRVSEDVVQVQQEALESMQEHYENALKMEQEGVIAKMERMHAKVALSEAEKRYNQAVRDAKLAKTALLSMINEDKALTTSTRLFITPEDAFQNLVFYQDNALRFNSGLKEIDLVHKLSDVAVTNERSTYYPNIFAFGSLDLYNYQLTPLFPSWFVGVGLNYTIFEGLSGYNKVKAAKSIRRSVGLKKQRAEKDIKTLVEQIYIEIENARSNYKAVETSIAFTKEYLKVQKKSFSQGIATSLDVVDAQLALSAAKLEAIMSAYKFDIGLVSLLTTSGLFSDFEEYRVKADVELGL